MRPNIRYRKTIVGGFIVISKNTYTMAGKTAAKATSSLNWRTRKKIEEAAIDKYLSEHQLGIYAPQGSRISTAQEEKEVVSGSDQQLAYKAPESLPDSNKVSHLLDSLSEAAYAGMINSGIESRLQAYEQASVQIRQLSRTFQRAFTE
jgi:hypothetical protein